MSYIDWIVMISFLLFVTIYGTIKSRGSKNIQSYLLADKSTPWYTVALSIMATQASAITFLSTPGQAYVDGMRFVQFYLGLPIAMIILSVTAVPIYHRLKVFTAYEYLEQRFDLKNRILGAVLFLMQRGLAAGFTIFAPALIISVLLGWNLQLTIIGIGVLVIIYTTVGGTNAVNKTHLQQMIIIFFGMVASFFMIYQLLPENVGPIDALFVAGKLGKLNAIDFSFDLNNRYTFWSGIIGGTFLMLSYFGTDQSQVQRYLSGKSIKESRMGLLINGMIKIPMQFFILFIGAMVFVFYQFISPPVFFNTNELQKVKASDYATQFNEIQKEYDDVNAVKTQQLNSLLSAVNSGNKSDEAIKMEEVRKTTEDANRVREEALKVMKAANPEFDPNDTNYIFLNFVINYLPVGLIGLVLAAIFSASMSSTSAELNALTSATVVDLYRRLYAKNESEAHYLKISKYSTVFWGCYAMLFALFANMLGSLIEAVNILGSLFYGTILGLFIVAFYMKKIGGNSVFFASIIAEVVVINLFFFTDMPYLWFNFVGSILVVIISWLVNPYMDKKKPAFE